MNEGGLGAGEDPNSNGMKAHGAAIGKELGSAQVRESARSCVSGLDSQG